MNARFVSLWILTFALQACCSTGASHQGSPEQGSQSTPQPSTGAPTVSRVNEITFSATIQSVRIIDSVDFAVSARVDTSSSTEGEALTPGQTIELHPAYVRPDSSRIDLKAGRNSKLYGIRSLAPGSVLRGTAYLDAHQRWMLTDCQ